MIDELSPRSKDTIVGVGERLACKLVGAILRDKVSVNPFVDLLIRLARSGLLTVCVGC